MAEEKQKDQQTEQLVDLGAATTNTSRGAAGECEDDEI